MVGDILAGAAVLVGGVLLLMGATGSYAILSQFGISLPGGAEVSTPEQSKQGVSGQMASTGLQGSIVPLGSSLSGGVAGLRPA